MSRTKYPSRSVRELADMVADFGWGYAGMTSGNHARFQHASGRTYVTSATPGDRRTQLNAKSQMKRIAVEAQREQD